MSQPASPLIELQWASSIFLRNQNDHWRLVWYRERVWRHGTAVVTLNQPNNKASGSITAFTNTWRHPLNQ
jgi:hypothetical protein